MVSSVPKLHTSDEKNNRKEESCSTNALCPNVGFSAIYEPDCLPNPPKVPVFNETNNAAATNDTTMTGNADEEEMKSSNGTNIIIYVLPAQKTTKRPVTTNPTTNNDPFGEDERDRRGKLMVIVLPIVFSLIFLFVLICFIRTYRSKNGGAAGSDGNNEEEGEEVQGESRCYRFWSNHGYQLPDPNPNAANIYPMVFV